MDLIVNKEPKLKVSINYIIFTIYFFTNSLKLVIKDKRKIKALIGEKKINIIINCAAYTSVDLGEIEIEKIKEIKGAELDKLMDETEAYLSRLKELRKQIEKRTNEKIILQIKLDLNLRLLYNQLLRSILWQRPHQVNHTIKL
jgi:dTDP-4-dehydrorhamnose reductase